jgi:hypothetical protein
MREGPPADAAGDAPSQNRTRLKGFLSLLSDHPYQEPEDAMCVGIEKDGP